MDTIYQTGNIVRLQCEFKDFDGNLINPALIKFKLYDNKSTLVDEYTLDASYQLSQGVYYFDYTSYIPTDVFYEWYGEINGNASIKRGKLRFRFI